MKIRSRNTSDRSPPSLDYFVCNCLQVLSQTEPETQSKSLGKRKRERDFSSKRKFMSTPMSLDCPHYCKRESYRFVKSMKQQNMYKQNINTKGKTNHNLKTNKTLVYLYNTIGKKSQSRVSRQKSC